MMRILKRLVLLTVFAMIAGTVWLVIDMRSYLFTPLTIPTEGMVFEVHPGNSLRKVAQQLSVQGILSKPRYLVWYARWYKLNDRIHIGEYQIEPGDTPATLLDHLTQGHVIQYTLTIVEGWTFEQMLQAVNDNPILTHTLKGQSGPSIMQILGHGNVYPEGRFLPDTYQFTRGTTDVVFLQRAFQAMQTFLQQQWEQRDSSTAVRNIDQALTLASIVEKETGLASERQAISGVFNRRLQKNMKLQSDPTVIYAMGVRFKGNIRKRDLDIDSPYNTYRIYGLPPTPIALPGKAAIQATLHPDKSDALYFVSKSDGTGHSVFSATLEQHNNAVIKYQLKGRKRPFSSSP